MEKVLYIGLGGAVGSVLRYLISGWIQRETTPFPVGTIAVNTLGCLAMGFLAERLTFATVDPNLRIGVLVGLLGGFTTFSAFSWQTWRLFESGHIGLAAANVAVSVSTCFIGVVVGVRLARALLPL